MAAIDISSTSAPLNDGVLQLQNGVAMDSTLRNVADQNDTTSPLKLSTTAVQVVSPLRITTDDPSDMYLDCEDGSANNRFNITRNTASQQVNLNFASNPAGSTTTVGAIRTYVDGVNLSEVMEFREDGNVKVGGILSVGNYVNSTGFGQKIRVIGQANASVGIYRNQESAFGAKLEFMKSRGTYDAPVVVNAGDLLGNVGYFGYNGTSYSTSAGISSGVLSTTATGVEADVRFILYNNTGGNFNTMRLTKEGVGIGNALDYIPSATLQLRGSGSTSATTSLLVQNSGGTNWLQVKDDGDITNGANGSTELKFEISPVANKFFRLTRQSTNVDFYSGNGGNASIVTSGSEPFSLIASSAYLTLSNGGVSVGATLNTTNASAILDVTSTTKGFLPPRMTNAQRAAITTPAIGLMVYCTDAVEGLYIYKSTGWTFVI